MHKKKSSIILRGTAKSVAVSFFFAAIFILLSYAVIGKYLDNAVTIINKFNYEQEKNHNNVITYDQINKRLDPRPKYNQLWATIKIPSLKIELPVYEGDTKKVLKYGVGHPQGSYFPGEGNTIVLPGHNNSKTFMHLPEIKLNDLIILDTIYGSFTYKVIDTKIVSRKNGEALTYNTGKEIVILYTCYPTYSVGLRERRFVVYAELVGESYE